MTQFFIKRLASEIVGSVINIYQLLKGSLAWCLYIIISILWLQHHLLWLLLVIHLGLLHLSFVAQNWADLLEMCRVTPHVLHDVLLIWLPTLCPVPGPAAIVIDVWDILSLELLLELVKTDEQLAASVLPDLELALEHIVFLLHDLLIDHANQAVFAYLVPAFTGCENGWGWATLHTSVSAHHTSIA